MPYSGTRLCYDADSHIMELPDFLKEFADPADRDAVPEVALPANRLAEALGNYARTRAHSAEEVAEQVALGEKLITGPKGYFALGAFNRDERTQALDQLGFKRQLVFSTFSAGTIFRRMKGADSLQYAAARAHNRAMAHFCGADPRLMGIAALPLVDIPQALAEIDHIAKLGLKAAWIPHQPAGDKSPGHLDLDPIWAKLSDYGIPFALHVGGDPLQMNPAWMNNGRPIPTDWLGGGENLRGKDMTVLHQAAETFISVLVFDGVFQRHPKLKGIVVELGCGWVPELLVRLDWTHKAWSRSEPLLAELKTPPSQQIIEHMSVTPYPFENVGDIIKRSDPRLYMFASDYPHTEGSKTPMERFDASLEASGATQAVKDAFYFGNFARQFALAPAPAMVAAE